MKKTYKVYKKKFSGGGPIRPSYLDDPTLQNQVQGFNNQYSTPATPAATQGFFSKNSSTISGGANFAASAIDSINTGDGTSTGSVIGSTASSALKGAAAGTAILPGIGTAIGAGVGLVTGFIGAEGKRNAALAARSRTQQVQAANAVNQSNATIRGYDNYGVTGAQLYADGGEVEGPGPKPIITNDRNDPRLKAYTDSLNLYNGSTRDRMNMYKQFNFVKPGPSLNVEQGLRQAITDQPSVDYGKFNIWHSGSHEASAGRYEHQDYPDAYAKKLPSIANKPIGFSPELQYSEKYSPTGKYDMSAIYKKPNQPVVYQPQPKVTTINPIDTAGKDPNKPISPDNPIQVQKADGSVGTWGNDIKGNKIVVPQLNQKPITSTHDQWGNVISSRDLQSQDPVTQGQIKKVQDAMKSSSPYHYSKGGYVPYRMAYGGPLNDPQYEAEQGETIQGQPQLEEGNQLASDVHEIGGNTHENGGTMGQGGDRIFSDRLRITPELQGILKTSGIKLKSNSTYAEASNKLGKLKGKFEDKQDAVGKKTASLMIPRIDQALDDTFNDQEMGKYMKAYKKYAKGGLVQYASGGNPAYSTNPDIEQFPDYAPNGTGGSVVQPTQSNSLLNWNQIGNGISKGVSAIGSAISNNSGQVENGANYLANLGSINSLNTTVNPQYVANPNYNYTDRSGIAYSRNNALLKTGIKNLTNQGRTVNASNIGALYGKNLEVNSAIAANENQRKDAYNENYYNKSSQVNQQNVAISNKAQEDSRDLYNQKVNLKVNARNAFLQGIQGNKLQKQQADAEDRKLLTVLATNDNNGVMTRFLNNYGTYKDLLNRYKTLGN